MSQRFFIATAVCGHVGKGWGVDKDFAIKAKNKKEAAAIARQIPRVKHDYKKAIRNVWEVTFEEYINQKQVNDNDPFFKISNSSEQAAVCHNLDVYRLYDEEEERKYKGKKKVSKKAYLLRYSDYSDRYVG